MKHIQDIESMIRLLLRSETFHALVIDSPPGWGKSSTVRDALKYQSIAFETLNAYSTPLFLYNALCKTPATLHVIDDCAGLFGDSVALSILKAATWPSAGGATQREISWNTSSEKALTAKANFTGKLILLVNGFPQTREAKAFLSRTLYLRLALSNSDLVSMLKTAAQSAEFFSQTLVAEQVADYLVSRNADTANLNLRVLQLGYELALSEPDHWKEMLDLLVRTEEPTSVIARLANSQMSVEQQCGEFQNLTGLSRRTFFNYRVRLDRSVTS